MTNKRLSPQETGKVIRKTLRATFPETKFSVRMDRGTAYGSFSVSYIDGPSTSEVDAVLAPFVGKRFDGMDDSTHYTRNTFEVDGVTCETGAGYISISRDYSEEAKATARKVLADAGYVGSDLDFECTVRAILNGRMIDEAATYYGLRVTA